MHILHQVHHAWFMHLCLGLGELELVTLNCALFSDRSGGVLRPGAASPRLQGY
jgi:hypothetical protein